MSRRRLAAVLLLGLVMGGCSLAGRTFGRYYDDRSITGSVQRGLVGEHPRGLPRVAVDTYEGTVYLSGEVETAAQKAEAEAAAWRVEGRRAGHQRPARALGLRGERVTAHDGGEPAPGTPARRAHRPRAARRAGARVRPRGRDRRHRLRPRAARRRGERLRRPRPDGAAHHARLALSGGREQRPARSARDDRALARHPAAAAALK